MPAVSAAAVRGAAWDGAVALLPAAAVAAVAAARTRPPGVLQLLLSFQLCYDLWRDVPQFVLAVRVPAAQAGGAAALGRDETRGRAEAALLLI